MCNGTVNILLLLIYIKATHIVWNERLRERKCVLDVMDEYHNNNSLCMMKQYKKEGEEIFHSRWLYTYITCVLYKIINFFFFALADIFHHYNVMCKACMPCTRLLTYLHSFHIYFSAIIKKYIFFCLAFSRWFLWLLAYLLSLPYCLHVWVGNNTYL